MSEFKDTVMIITGASSGIGEATARLFAEKGGRVVLAARRTAKGEQIAREIREQGGEALFIATDVADADQVKHLHEETVNQYGGLDFAFNNAGVEGSPFVKLTDYDEDDWHKVMDINLNGVWRCMRAQIPLMLKRGGGSIVNMSSIAGLKGTTLNTAYGASKHAVSGLTRSVALEYAKQNIRVNGVAPAVVKSEMTDRAFFHDDELGEKIVASHPVGRVGKPEEVAAAVLFLCSAGAGFMTGHIMPIDGGRLA